MAVAVSGDTIQIQSGTYTDCFVITQDNLTIQGVGSPRPAITGPVCNEKGLIVTTATSHNTVITNLELYGATDSDDNGAGVRHQGNGITMTDMYFHDNQDGVLGGGNNDEIVVENSTFEHNGYDNATLGYAHNIYIGQDTASFVAKNDQFLEAAMGGDEFKSRADYTEVDCSMIAALNSTSSFTIDIPQGGQFVMNNSIVEKGPNSPNFNTVIDFGEDPVHINAPPWSISISNSTIIDDVSSGTEFILAAQTYTPTFQLTNVTLVGPEVPANLPISGGYTQQTDRSAAGLGAFPALPSLPSSCGAVGAP